MQYQTKLIDAQATDQFGTKLALALIGFVNSSENKSCLIYLQGELGAGKTSLVRACLRELGIKGAIKSPTYTLLEPYEISFQKKSLPLGLKIAHLDLYRLQEPEELDYIGGRDLKDHYQIIFVEWPQKALGAIPLSDINIQLNHIDKGREISVQTDLVPILEQLKV